MGLINILSFHISISFSLSVYMLAQVFRDIYFFNLHFAISLEIKQNPFTTITHIQT